jgi:hypothetical protein
LTFIRCEVSVLKKPRFIHLISPSSSAAEISASQEAPGFNLKQTEVVSEGFRREYSQEGHADMLINKKCHDLNLTLDH